MGWAGPHITKLRNGITVKFRPGGHSMSGRIEHKQLVTVEPTCVSKLQVGDVVLCKVHGNEYLHLIKAIRQQGMFLHFQIGNNHGRVNGWTGANHIYGKVTQIED